MVSRAAALLALATLALLPGGAAKGASPDASAIAAGDTHACALTGGGVKCWGSNGYGQLGDGTTTTRSTPVDVVGLGSGVQAIAAGGAHTCALTSGGGVKCWGNNGGGRLGDGTTTDRSTPVTVSGFGSGITAIEAGYDFTCALSSDSLVGCWGRNSYGQLGDGTTTDRSTPVAVVALSGVQAIAVGAGHTCALTSGGKVDCWGLNNSGQLGDGTTTNRSIRVEVSGPLWQAVSAGGSHTCAITAVGGVRCWGGNSNGQLGDGTTTDRSTPVDVSGLGPSSNVTAIAAGAGHTCALTSGSGVKCWGLNNDGQLGDGTTTGSSTPVNVSGLGSDVQAIATGAGHACALTSGGGVKCWGGNSAGQLGNGTTTNSTSPVTVAGIATKTLTISKSGSGAGTVTSSPAGIDCGSDCASDYASGTSITLTASASSGSTFSGWSGACSGTTVKCTLTMSADRSATATFATPSSSGGGTTTTVTTTVPTPTTPTPTPAAGTCVVPNVRGKQLAAAKQAIKKGNCKVGSIRRGYSRSVKKGAVVWQSPRAGTRPKNGRVSLLVSRGPRQP